MQIKQRRTLVCSAAQKLPVKPTVFWLVFLVLLIIACSGTGGNADSRVLNVYAAASLTDAFTEIGQTFEAGHPEISIAFNFGGSQNLRTQIEQGAPADVFAPANNKEMNALVEGSFIAPDAPIVFLTNQLVVILPEENPADIASVEDLGKPGLKIVLAAEEVPAGRYAREALEKLNMLFGADYKDSVLANVVSNEDNIRQAVTKIQLGEADAGIVYVSDAVAVPGLIQLAIPGDANVIAEYPIAPLAESENSELAEEFIAYILSADGQAVLEKWGFTPVAP
jgi:molybdate transport system substrate-binding protein